MASTRQRKPVADGERAPAFRLDRLEGGSVELSQLLATGPILLAFFKVSCPVCQLTLPFLQRLHTAGRMPVYGISQNAEDDTRDFNARFGVSFPTLLDREEDDFPASNAYHIASVPTIFLVERSGTIARTIEGWQKREIEQLGSQAGVAVFRPGDNVPEWKAG